MQYESEPYKLPNQKYTVPPIIEEPAQSDADSYYDTQDVQSLGIMNGIPQGDQYQGYQFPVDLDSEPPIPEDYYEPEPFSDLLSSPPTSPTRNPPLPQYPPGNYDFRSYQQMQPVSSPDFYSDFEPPVSEPVNYPFRVPLHYQRLPSRQTLFPPQSFPDSIPDLSPALSEPVIDSPQIDSDGFPWQPVYVTPKTEPMSSPDMAMGSPSLSSDDNGYRSKLKRKTCLPEGVVEKYVGHTEDNSFICLYPNCQRLFKRTHNLRSHIQTHLCDRPYQCSFCGNRFVRPHDMRRHERGHTNEKPFSCPCGKKFSRNDAMTRHRMRNICSGSLSKMPQSPRAKSSINKSPMLSQEGRTPRARNTPTVGHNLSSEDEHCSDDGNTTLTEASLGTSGNGLMIKH